MAQLQVGQLERCEMLRRDGCIKISGLDAGELGQVVDHLQPGGQVNVYCNQRDRSLCDLNMRARNQEMFICPQNTTYRLIENQS